MEDTPLLMFRERCLISIRHICIKIIFILIIDCTVYGSVVWCHLLAID